MGIFYRTPHQRQIDNRTVEEEGRGAICSVAVYIQEAARSTIPPDPLAGKPGQNAARGQGTSKGGRAPNRPDPHDGRKRSTQSFLRLDFAEGDPGAANPGRGIGARELRLEARPLLWA